MIDIRSALEQALLTLDKAHFDARFEAELLLGHLLGKNRAYLFAHPEKTLTDEQWSNYQALIKNRAQGTPIAYLTGQREFWSLPLKVSPDTLIPRHETELLVELALKNLPNEPNLKILDLGTGSGAIALALASERPDWQISACDASVHALEIAQENAKQLQISNVHFYLSDWFDSLPNTHYHAIISNPPYISENDPHLLQGDVRFEPLRALVSSQEGLADLQYIITSSYERLVPNGLLLLEHGYDQKFSIRAILNKLGYCNVCCWQDIAGNDRVSGGWRSRH